MKRSLALLLPLVACTSPDPSPRPMPPATGAPFDLQLGAVHYIITRSPLSSAPNGEVMRVYRTGTAALDYSEGLAAKTAAEAYCAEWNRELNPAAMGMFEPTGAWVFPGGCA